MHSLLKGENLWQSLLHVPITKARCSRTAWPQSTEGAGAATLGYHKFDGFEKSKHFLIVLEATRPRSTVSRAVLPLEPPEKGFWWLLEDLGPPIFSLIALCPVSSSPSLPGTWDPNPIRTRLQGNSYAALVIAAETLIPNEVMVSSHNPTQYINQLSRSLNSLGN